MNPSKRIHVFWSIQWMPVRCVEFEYIQGLPLITLSTGWLHIE